MLAKKFRLPIQEFYRKSSQNTRTKYFTLKIFKPEKSYARLGIVVSKKVASKASGRNSLRRLIFNFARDNYQRLVVNDYLIILLPVSAKVSKDDLITALEYALKTKTNPRLNV
ncbi:MAG: ribonuclease P protein component [bacterium]|nr:ribonuclease P protein component [bacterium]